MEETMGGGCQNMSGVVTWDASRRYEVVLCSCVRVLHVSLTLRVRWGRVSCAPCIAM